MTTTRRALTALMAVVMLAGCTHKPQHESPTTPMATIYTTNVPDGHCHEDDPCFPVTTP